ncbi:uncharacterized protein LOC131688354 [Topomyia yanbarensis]|uniref:uncharacterized protein LOC131688354 n=1 Tax=Topomyia yanbarensis TaxID=2498891 RepID=UPI00273BA37D|nr:uncharacterized protein LOC131688354 [Topomyia yanbarensis]
MAESNLNPEQHQPGNGLPGGPLPPGVNPQHPGMQQNHQRHSAPFFNGPPSAQQSSSTSSSSAEASYQLFRQLMQQQQVFMQQQQQQLMQQQQDFFRSVISSISIQVPPNPEMILDSLANNIKEFRYDPDGNITFAACKRYRCLQVTKQPTDDYVTYACRFNKTCVEFELSKLNEEQFKCLMFVCGLKSEGDSEIRTRLLSKIEERDDITLDHLSEDCQRLLCLKRDTAMIESSSSPSSKPPVETAGPDKNIPSTPCWFCGGMHFVRDCSHRSHKCKDCGIVGHREGYCSTAKRTSKASRNKKHPGSYATKSSLKSAYPSVFRNELGLCTKTKVKLELIPGTTPVFRAKRPVAYAVHSSVDNELDRLERANIITPVDFSDWAAPIVVVRKTNGSIRICGDYSTGLNNALQPHQYPLPLPEIIFNKLANCIVFSRIDLLDAFLQVEVDESSRELLTINTHRGLYRYNRLTPGVKAAPGALQQLIDTMLAGLPHTCGYLDDVVVGGVNPENHWANLHAVFQRNSDFGFTIRVEKCIFAQPQIKYVGHLLDRNGLRPDPSKVQAINEMPPPTDVSGVRSFL